MKAIIVPVGAMPRTVEIDGSLASMQEAVGGRIEPCSWVFNDGPAVYVNEEGKFACEPNRAVYATEADAGCVRWDGTVVEEGDLLGILFGDVLCVGFDPETGEEFRAVVDALLRLGGIEVELCGAWLWISGDTYQNREALKACGCLWSRSKQRWYWRHAEDDCRWSRGKTSMGEIRSKYGSEWLERGKEDEREKLPA